MYTWLPLNTSADLKKLADPSYIATEYCPDEVAKKLVQGISSAVKAVLIEHDYIDKDYRSTYYNFYAKKGQRYNPNCVRLHFFDELVSYKETDFQLECDDNELSDHYFGYMVLRPTGIATIGRSVLSPDVRNGASGSIMTAYHKVHLLGYKLIVQGFPSMDQHIDISVCAHVACWSILRHYSERFNTHKEYHVHDITLMAQQFNPGGLVPSKGLEVSHAERVFQEAGTYPVHVAREDNGTNSPPPYQQDPSFYRQLIAYVESGFPLFAAMHTESHAVAVVGSKRSTAVTGSSKSIRYAWDKVESLVIIDDNYLPYLTMPIKGSGQRIYSCAENIDAFIVALPEKVYYPADAVDSFAPVLRKLSTVVSLPPEDKTIIRYFITTGSALRHFMRDRASEFDPELLKTVMQLPFAQFIWIVEFATEEQWASGQISARAVLDATASLRDIMPVWLFHNNSQALIFERSTVDRDLKDIKALPLSGMENTALTRMDQNLRPIKSK